MSSDDVKPPPSLSADDVRRIVFATLYPAAKLATQHKVGLKELAHLAQLAYFQQLRRDGQKMREISASLGVGMSKVAALSKELKRHYLEPERAYGIGRRLLATLWAAPLTVGRLEKGLPDVSKADIHQALEALLEEGRVIRRKGRTDRYQLAAGRHRMDIAPWIAKIDGLNTLMKHVFEAIDARLIANRGDATVRNVVFRAKAEDIDRLRKAYEEVLFPLICELDEAAGDGADTTEVALSILWSTRASDD